MSYCIYCGTKNRDEALFCKNCGKPLSEPESEEDKVEEQVVEEGPVAEKEPVVQETPVVPESPLDPETHAAPESSVAPVIPESQAISENQFVQGVSVAQEQRKPSYSTTVNVSKPKNKALITIIILIPIILLLAALVGGAIFLFSASKTIKDEMSDTMEVVNHETEANQENENGQQDTIAIRENVSDESKAEEADGAEDATDVFADNTTSETAASSAKSLSTRTKPSLAEFQTWFINGAMRRGKPSGVKILSDISEISGSWKAFLFLDPSNKYDCKAHTLGTITIDGTNEKVKLYLKRYSTRFFSDNETLNEANEAPDAFSARWSAGKLNASGVGSMTITDFWEQDGKQYAIGTFSAQDGIPASLAMVRP